MNTGKRKKKRLKQIQKVEVREAFWTKRETYCRGLRRRATAPEHALRAALRDAGIRYHFQHPLTNVGTTTLYIVDFYIKRPGRGPLVVEVDGPSHQHSRRYDATRTAWITNRYHATVLRFTNEETLDAPASVVRQIQTYLDDDTTASDTLAEAPRCRVCRKPASLSWRRFKNGTVHLVWWCCNGQRAPNPLPARYAARFGLPNKETAELRFALEHATDFP